MDFMNMKENGIDTFNGAKRGKVIIWKGKWTSIIWEYIIS